MVVQDSTSGVHSFGAMLAAAQVGAAWACTMIWVEYAPPVAAFLKARGSSEPEDLTSDVFLAVFEQLPKFVGGESEFRSFVFSIAYRRLVDELRKRSTRGIHSEWTAETDSRTTASAEDEALRQLSEASALSMLDELSEDQRDVMVLRFVTDLTIDQIAEVVGKRPASVKALQRRALESLRKKFASTRTPGRLSHDSGD
jgi:RNA polymerase sigma factor (sigma-70 family)